jgi:hypothetical protein
MQRKSWGPVGGADEGGQDGPAGGFASGGDDSLSWRAAAGSFPFCTGPAGPGPLAYSPWGPAAMVGAGLPQSLLALASAASRC